MSGPASHAFGAPGIAPTWSSSDKDYVTAALDGSRLWATIGHGIINEVYWPSTGQPQVRDLGFYLVGKGRWIDLKRERRYRLLTPGPALPALNIVHHGEDYQLTLEILPDPTRDVLLVRFALVGEYRLVLLLAPHLGSTGRDNSAWIDDGAAYAQGGGFSLCLAASTPIEHLSCGFVGASDGWQDLTGTGPSRINFSRRATAPLRSPARRAATTACSRSVLHIVRPARIRAPGRPSPQTSTHCAARSSKPGTLGARL